MSSSDPVLILAPMRGITTMHYRQAFVRHFHGLDIGMAPFIPTVRAERINPKLLKDLLPENNAGLPLIPQLIGNNAADFVHMAKALHGLGYDEINWNLGCPHKPIRNKRRGSGLLPHPEIVDAFLDEVFSESPCRVSVKVRLGVSSKTDLLHLIPVLNKYPLSEVIIHPRTAEQMYNGKADLDAFEEAFTVLTPPVCYNGDINGPASFRIVQDRFPSITRFMLGRGLLSNPFLCEIIKGGSSQTGNAVERIAAFHDDLLEAYEAVLHGDHPVLGKMKEFWTYQSVHLSNGAKMFKKLKKARMLSSYRSIVSEFLQEASWNAPL
jgi:tRNA-dihydrouridine synthase B